MSTIAEVSKETLEIEAFLKSFNPGEKILYQTIENETKVKMNNRGKQFMRSALNRLKIEYSCIHGVGIELGSPVNTTGIIAHKVVKIDKAVKRANKTTRRLSDQFYDQLSDDDKRHVAFVQSALAPIANYSKAARLFFQKPKVISIN